MIMIDKIIVKKRIVLLFVILLFALFQNRDIQADNNIYRDIIDRGIATYEDGCRALSCFTDISTKDMSFEELAAELKEKGIIAKRWEYEAKKPLTRGIAAYMVCKILNIKGGLTMRILSTTRRYASLECQYNGILPIGNNKMYLSGHDLLALLYRVEQFVKAKEKERKL